jgi:hypothetical protein
LVRGRRLFSPVVERCPVAIIHLTQREMLKHHEFMNK